MAETQNSKKEAFQRKCSIIISLIASMLLVNNLGSQNAAGEASFQNAAAINTYAFYQAKTVRQNDLNLAAQTLDGIANTAVPLANESAKQNLRQQAEELRAKALGYESDTATGEGKKELLAKAKAAEKVRDQAMGKGPYFDFAGLLLQLSIILISVVLITERRTLYLSGMTAAILGTFLSMDGFFLFLRIPLLG
jgi:hypothetical protein